MPPTPKGTTPIMLTDEQVFELMTGVAQIRQLHTAVLDPVTGIAPRLTKVEAIMQERERVEAKGPARTPAHWTRRVSWTGIAALLTGIAALCAALRGTPLPPTGN